MAREGSPLVLADTPVDTLGSRPLGPHGRLPALRHVAPWRKVDDVPKVSVWVPDELLAEVRQELPDLNLSATLRAGLEAALVCEHRRVVCGDCATAIDVAADLVQPALARFYSDALDRLAPLVHEGRTAEGAARVLKDVAERHQIARARSHPLPRPNRADRLRARVRDLPAPSPATSDPFRAGDGAGSDTADDRRHVA